MGQTTTRRLAACAATGLTLAVAGCGSSSSPNSGASFLAAVNAQCQKTAAATAALPKPTTSAELVKYVQQELTITQQAQAKYKSLTPPSDKQATWAQVTANVDMTVSLFPQILAAAQAGDTAKLQQLVAQIQTLSAQDHQLAKKLGATGCLSNSSSGTTS